MESLENQTQVFHPSHRPWKSLRDSLIPTASTTASYIKGEAKEPRCRINNLGWAKLNCRNGPSALAKRRRDLFLSYLVRLGLRHFIPEGAYFVLADISSCGFPDDYSCCQWLVEELGVAAVPGSVFFHRPETRYVRFHFSKSHETLIAAGERLLRLSQKI